MKFHAIGDSNPPKTLLKQEGLQLAEASFRSMSKSIPFNRKPIGLRRLREAAWIHSGLGMVSFNFLFLGRWLNYILGLVDVQVLRGVQSQNTETIKHQML